MSQGVEFVAEVSSNHNRDLARSLRFIEEASRIGCSAVKFQLFKIEELFALEVLERKPELRERKKWELPIEFLPKLSSKAHELGLKFGCTPFYLKAVEELAPHVDFLKIASYELLWNDLLQACAQSGKRVILSTGMATMDEIKSAHQVLQRSGAKDIVLLHCTSAYPTPADQSNLSAIETIRKECGCPVGWSDHTVSEAVILRAIHKYGAAVVEFHLDIDEQGVEHKFGHNWHPDQMKRVIDNVRVGFQADGDGRKAPVPAELDDRDWRADPSDGLRPFKHVRRKIELELPKFD